MLAVVISGCSLSLARVRAVYVDTSSRRVDIDTLETGTLRQFVSGAEWPRILAKGLDNKAEIRVVDNSTWGR